jgi:hypothetical protein
LFRTEERKIYRKLVTGVGLDSQDLICDRDICFPIEPSQLLVFNRHPVQTLASALLSSLLIFSGWRKVTIVGW